MDERDELVELTLTEVLPELAHPQYDRVRELDAFRERLANEYAAKDGAALLAIREIMRHDGTGNWTRYTQARSFQSLEHVRLRMAEGRPYSLLYWSRSVIGRYIRRPKHAPERCWNLRCYCNISETDALRMYGYHADADALERADSCDAPQY